MRYGQGSEGCDTSHDTNFVRLKETRRPVRPILDDDKLSVTRRVRVDSDWFSCLSRAQNFFKKKLGKVNKLATLLPIPQKE